MSFAIRAFRPVWAGLALTAISTAATAQLGARDPMAFVQAAEGSYGSGSGSVTMPTITSEGLLVGVFVEEKAGKRYTLEAKLTTFVPGLFDPFHRVAFGGVYGDLREVDLGGSLGDAQPELVGHVEGLWRMEKDLTGEYEVFVHRRASSQGAELAGAIRGIFRVAVLDDAMPAPQRPDFGAALPSVGSKASKLGAWSAANPGTSAKGLGDAASHGSRAPALGDVVSHTFRSADSQRADLSDARSAATPTKDTGLADARSSSNPKKPSGSPLADARRAAKKGAGSSGYGTAADGGLVVVPRMMGAFRARLKLIE